MLAWLRAHALLPAVCRCIEFLKLTTSKGRSVSAGRVGPVADLMTSAPTAGSGQLLAIKGSSKPNQGKQLWLGVIKTLQDASICASLP